MAKSILITGASGGIGSEIAMQAGQQGYKVGLLDLNKEMLAEVESEIPNSIALPTDVTDEKSVAETLKFAMKSKIVAIEPKVEREGNKIIFSIPTDAGYGVVREVEELEKTVIKS